MEFVAGIDGGGTRTTLALRSIDGKEEERILFGAFNLNSIGEERFSALLDEIVAVLNEKGDCLSICIGSAGISNPRHQKLIDDAMSKGGIRKYRLVGDHEIGYYGALDGGSGISVIAGTGSICFGMDRNGVMQRSGGWGHIIGDEGSGYALSRDALVAVTREMDGWGEKTGLREAFATCHGLSTRNDIISFVYNGDKGTIASLAPTVDRIAAEGDGVALSIVENNARLLLSSIRGLYARLGVEKVRVVLLGGLVTHDTAFRKALVSEIASTCPFLTITEPVHDAVTGAVMLAMKELE